MSDTASVDSGLPKSSKLSGARSTTITLHAISLSILLGLYGWLLYESANDSSGWAALGVSVLILFIGGPAYLFSLISLIVYGIMATSLSGKHSNVYSNSLVLTVLASLNPLLIIVILITVNA